MKKATVFGFAAMVAAGAAMGVPGVPTPMKEATAVMVAPSGSTAAVKAEDVAMAVSRDGGRFKLSASMRLGADSVVLTSTGRLEAVGTPVTGAKGVARIQGKSYSATVHVGNRSCSSSDECYEVAVGTIHGYKGMDVDVIMTGR